MKHRQGFTLIELLIVVAIIAILAAIAVPNFLEAQTRSKVSRVRADQRTLVTAMETYYVDFNSYPLIAAPSLEPGAINAATNPAYQSQLKAYVALSTPLAYISSARLTDPFSRGAATADNPDRVDARYFQVGSGKSGEPAPILQVLSDGPPDYAWTRRAYPLNVYCIVSAGPDEKDASDIVSYPFSSALAYDPTNGTVSAGDIFRCGPSDQTPRCWRPPYPEYVLGEPPY